jgi:hypothetical protein
MITAVPQTSHGRTAGSGAPRSLLANDQDRMRGTDTRARSRPRASLETGSIRRLYGRRQAGRRRPGTRRRQRGRFLPILVGDTQASPTQVRASRCRPSATSGGAARHPRTRQSGGPPVSQWRASSGRRRALRRPDHRRSNPVIGVRHQVSPDPNPGMRLIPGTRSTLDTPIPGSLRYLTRGTHQTRGSWPIRGRCPTRG